MIERARQLQHDKGQSNLTWQVGDVLPLPYANDTFSLVVTRFTFHHFVDPQAVLGESGGNSAQPPWTGIIATSVLYAALPTATT